MYGKFFQVLFLISLFCFAGCEASLQGARRQFEETETLSSRIFQGSKKIPLSLPTPEAAVRGLPGPDQLKAFEEGLQKQHENFIAGTEGKWEKNQ